MKNISAVAKELSVWRDGRSATISHAVDRVLCSLAFCARHENGTRELIEDVELLRRARFVDVQQAPAFEAM